MDALFEIDDQGRSGWVGGRGRVRAGSRTTCAVGHGLRFAFYGRTSTEEFQDPVTSRAWQREVAEAVIAGHGVIIAEFFDVGCSRRVAWERRPQAAALLAARADPDRWFDAVVVGEFERAFTDRQFQQVAELLARHGVQVWLPEAGGPVDLDDPTHRALMLVLAAQSRAGGGAVAASDVGGDARAGGRAGPVPGRSPALRVSAGGCRPASEPGARGVGASAAAVGSGSGDRAACAVDVRPSAWPGAAWRASPAS